MTSTVVVTSLTAFVTAAVAYRSLAAGYAVTLLALIASNGSIVAFKDPFLTARWAALASLSVVVLFRSRTLFPLPFRGIAVLLYAIPVLGLLSAAWSLDPRVTIARSLAFAVVLWLAFSLAVMSGDGSRYVDALAVLSVGVLIASIVDAGFSSRAINGPELRGIFENQNGLGLFLGLTFPPVAAALNRRVGQPVASLAVAPYAGMMAITGSRSGLGALAIGIALLELRAPRRRRIAVYLVAGVTSAALAAAAFHPSGATAPVGGRGHGSGAVSFIGRLTGSRSEAWRVTAGFIASRPFVGYGFGMGDRVFAAYPDRARFKFFEGNNPNNAYLQLLLELGVVGLAIVGVLLLSMIRRAIVLVRASQPYGSRSALAAMFCAGAVAAIVESLLTSPGAPWALLIWFGGASAFVAEPGLGASRPPGAGGRHTT